MIENNLWFTIDFEYLLIVLQEEVIQLVASKFMD